MVDGAALAAVLLGIDSVGAVGHQGIVFHDGLGLVLVGNAIHDGIAIGDHIVLIGLGRAHVVGILPGDIEAALFVPEVLVDILDQLGLHGLPLVHHIRAVA